MALIVPAAELDVIWLIRLEDILAFAFWLVLPVYYIP